MKMQRFEVPGNAAPFGACWWELVVGIPTAIFSALALLGMLLGLAIAGRVAEPALRKAFANLPGRRPGELSQSDDTSRGGRNVSRKREFYGGTLCCMKSNPKNQ